MSSLLAGILVQMFGAGQVPWTLLGWEGSWMSPWGRSVRACTLLQGDLMTGGGKVHARDA